jgi:hypothetical protein
MRPLTAYSRMNMVGHDNDVNGVHVSKQLRSMSVVETHDSDSVIIASFDFFTFQNDMDLL